MATGVCWNRNLNPKEKDSTMALCYDFSKLIEVKGTMVLILLVESG